LRGTATAPSAGFDAQNGTGYTPIAFTYGGASPADSVEVVFTNDAYNGNLGEDRNLFVDKIEVNGTEFEAEVDGNFLTDDPNLQTALGGSREDIRVNGALTFDLTPAATQSLTVFAGGEEAQGNLPSFDVLVDGAVIGGDTVTNAVQNAPFDGVFDQFDFTYQGNPTPDRIQIVYDSDFYVSPGGDDNDSNLFVDKIALNGVEFEAENDGNFVTDDPSLQTALGGSREDLRANGILTFDDVFSA